MRSFIVLVKTLFMAACAITVFGFITWQLQRLDPFIPVTLPPWLAVGGIVLMVAGAVLALACFGLYSASGGLSRHAHFPDPEVFISWGPYKYVRNPMSKGGWTVLCGWGFFQLSPSILLFGFFMAGFLNLFVVYVEEPKLEQRFGESYREYKRRVNRWVPSWRMLPSITARVRHRLSRYANVFSQRHAQGPECPDDFAKKTEPASGSPAADGSHQGSVF